MAIDIGLAAENRSYAAINGYTRVALGNPANVTGILTTFELWMNANAPNTKVGTFTVNVGDATKYTNRDYESLGTVTAGSKQTFTGLNCDVVANDYLGNYFTANGYIDRSDSGGSGCYAKQGDTFGAGEQTYTILDTGRDMSAYGTGISAAVNTTQAATGVTEITCTGNGNITDTGGSGSDVTRRGFCYKVGTSGDPTTADLVAYDDGTFGTGAYTKAITGLNPGTAYRVRAYCVNVYGTFYGDTVQVATLAGAAQVIIF